MTEKRSIFEDVGSNEKIAVQPTGVALDAAKAGARRAVSLWLKALFSLVVIMIAVGGLTRLTDSGLSITVWAPVTGAIPPLSSEDWQRAFDLYRQIPEYQLQNRGMSLSEFQFIYWWEWGHRQLGRLIGLVWGAGFLYFLLRRHIPTGWTLRLLGLGALGGLQGAIGWWMVSSGLTGTMLDVASYRLATHLGLAFLILGLLAWYIYTLARDPADLLLARRQRDTGLLRLSKIFLPLLFLQILMGALVAGIDAGRTYTDWPLMAGVWLPPELFELIPFWSNFFENPALVQFNHRLLAYALFGFGLFIGFRAVKSPLSQLRRWHARMGMALIAQVLLGIITVMTVAPWYFAIAHQFLAVVLFAIALRAAFEAAYPAAETVRT